MLDCDIFVHRFFFPIFLVSSILFLTYLYFTAEVSLYNAFLQRSACIASLTLVHRKATYLLNFAFYTMK